MRQILVQRARARHAAKRGGARERITLDDANIARAAEGFTQPASGPDEVDLLALDDALTQLAQMDPELARLVELRYFGGMTVEETAQALNVSPATVKRQWITARAWLRRAIEGDTPSRDA
jgi:RNA polymerase sigma factor (TIGR02999 family)